jgi:CRP-like cAMP-binding protein
MLFVDDKGDVVLPQPTPTRLTPDLIRDLHEIKAVQQFSKDTKLFEQGSPAEGVYLVEAGEVRLLLTAGASERQILEITGPGAMLGLSESLCGERYRSTAEAGEATTAAFIRREDLVEFLREHGDHSMEILRLLSDELHGLYQKFRSISAHPGRPRQRALQEQLN